MGIFPNVRGEHKKISELPPPSSWLYIPVPKKRAGLWNSGTGIFVGMKIPPRCLEVPKKSKVEERYEVDHPGHERSLGDGGRSGFCCEAKAMFCKNWGLRFVWDWRGELVKYSVWEFYIMLPLFDKLRFDVKNLKSLHFPGASCLWITGYFLGCNVNFGYYPPLPIDPWTKRGSQSFHWPQPM